MVYVVTTVVGVPMTQPVTPGGQVVTVAVVVVGTGTDTREVNVVVVTEVTVAPGPTRSMLM